MYIYQYNNEYNVNFMLKNKIVSFTGVINASKPIKC